jgi:hypothetical protein
MAAVRIWSWAVFEKATCPSEHRIMRLSARLAAVADVMPSVRDEMFVLMDRHYENVQRDSFERDLREKRWVILLEEPASGRLCGFSTQTLLRVSTEDREITALFSGDTIINREHWGDPALTHVWGRLALSLIDQHADTELYWFLISQGYKTYRFLPVFFHEFFPRHDAPTPAWAATIIDALGRGRYPRQYDSTFGLVRATPGQYRLRPGVADITSERLHDPHVRFFQACNPAHAQGDELCCLAPLTRENFTRAAYRVIGPERMALEVS